MPTTTAPLDDYEFDLRGFLLIRSALTPQEVESLNDAYDRIPPLRNGEWYGNVVAPSPGPAGAAESGTPTDHATDVPDQPL